MDGRLERLQERRFISRVLATATLEPRWSRPPALPEGTRAGRVAIAALVQPFKRIAPQNISAQSLRGYGAAQPRKETAEVAEASSSACPLRSEDWCAAAPSLRWPCNLHRT